MGRRSLSGGTGVVVAFALAGCAALVAPAVAFAKAKPPPLPAAPAAVTFGRPTISGVQGLGYEQDLRRDDHDPSHPVLYTSVPATLASGSSWVWRSLDNGATFKWVPAAAPKEGRVTTGCVGGGDTELAVDTTGHVYFNDLSLTNFSAARSADRGATFVPTTCTAVFTTPDDRQWYAVDGDPTQPAQPGQPNSIYLTYDVVNGAVCSGPSVNNLLVMARSPAPGATVLGGVQFAPPEPLFDPLTGDCVEGIMGNDEVSPVTHNVFVVHDNATLDQVRIGKCTPVDFLTRPSGLSCTDKLIAALPNARTGGNFPSLAVDKAGNLFALWEQQARSADPATNTNDTLLYWSRSTDDGTTWSAPALVPTPGLHNNVYAWAAAGDSGRIDVAWYGTDAVSTLAPGGSTGTTPCPGPDGAFGHWGLYLSQSLNFTAATPTFAAPVLASEHHVHNGTLQTLIGGQCGNRALGDFLQLRIGPQGEANISYGEVNNRTTQARAMFVRQNGGSSVLAATPTVAGAASPTNRVSDPSGDGTYDAAGASSVNQPNMDILSADMRRLDAGHFRATITVADLSTLAPNPAATGDTDTTLVWQVQWSAPSRTDANGGEQFFASMESTNGGAPTFWDGAGASTAVGGGLAMTYPGHHQITGSYTHPAGAPGTITIDIPVADVAEPGAIDANLYNVTATSQSAPVAPETTDTGTLLGGTLFDLFDVAPAFDYQPSTDVGVTLSAPSLVAPSATFSYQATVANSGRDNAGSVTLTDPLPSSVTLVSATTTAGTCTGTTTVSCALGDLAPAGTGATSSAAVTVTVRAGSATTVTNTVSVASSGSPDTNMTNNTASVTTKVTTKKR